MSGQDDPGRPLAWSVGTGSLQCRCIQIRRHARRADRGTDEGYAKWEAVGLEK